MRNLIKINKKSIAKSHDDDIQQLKDEFQSLRNRLDEKKKDGWDKAAIIGQIISGSIIAIVGVALRLLYPQQGFKREANRTRTHFRT